jgi:hypothetical protein
MEALRTLNASHILDPYTFSFRLWLTLTTANRYKLFFVFGGWFTLTQIQLVKGITMALKQLSFFDGEIAVTREPARIMFIVEKTISRPNSLAELFMARSISYA